MKDFVEERKRRLQEVHELLGKKSSGKAPERLQRNSLMKQRSEGKEANVGTQLFVEEADSKLYPGMATERT